MGIFGLALGAVTLWVNGAKPKILILHSYSTDYVWAREINVGLNRVLAREKRIELRYHYMSTKRHTGADFKRRAGVAARKAIDDIKPDVVIAIDDNAQKLAARYYINHPNINIVFAGVNGCRETYGYRQAANATGILECKPASALEDVITMITGARDMKSARLLFVSDTSTSAAIDAGFLADWKWKVLKFEAHKAFDTFQDWKAFVLLLDGKADFLLVGGYRKLHRNKDEKELAGNFVPSSEVASWTDANSPIPVIGLNDFNAEDGVMLSVGSSPYEQGETAAEFALKILLEGIAPKEIPIRASKQYLVAMRKSGLKRRNLQVPAILEAFARVSDKYYE